MRELDELEGLGLRDGAATVPLETKDPNFRQLKRVTKSTEPVAAPSGLVTLEAPRRPLSDNDLDIPEFLRRKPTEVVEPVVEKAKDTGPEWYDPWSRGSSFGGGGGFGGGGWQGGNGYGPECKKERDEAREICVDGFERGLRWDGRGWRWISNYATGPYSKKDGGDWLIDDCKRGLISQICGGNAVELPPLAEVKKYLRK